MRDLPQIATTGFTNSSRVIHLGPCIIKAVHLAAAGANSDCQVYDGLNSSGELKAYLEALSGTSYTWRPGDGTDFDNGLYIVVSSSFAQVTVTYIPESKKDFI